MPEGTSLKDRIARVDQALARGDTPIGLPPPLTRADQAVINAAIAERSGHSMTSTQRARLDRSAQS